jgi:hypothetical protein
MLPWEQAGALEERKIQHLCPHWPAEKPKNSTFGV